MSNNELISVVIPTYKRNDTLVRAIESVYNQTYSNIEIIVVDDNANFPEVRQRNREILSEYKKVILVENSVNLGGGLSRNEGIKRSNGDYIAFLEALRQFRLLKPETIARMTAPQISLACDEAYWQRFPDRNYTYGLGVRCPFPGKNALDYGWTGAGGAFLAILPKEEITIFYVQQVYL